MAVAPVAAPAPGAPPPAGAAPPHDHTFGILDAVALIASIVYAFATFFLCLFGAHLPGGIFGDVQDAWGIVTVLNCACQVAPVFLTPDSFKHSVVTKLEIVSSFATIFVVVVVGALFLVGIATPHHWALMIWLYASGAGLIDLMSLRHAYYLSHQQ